MTVQPAFDEPFFEMADAYRWFNKRYTLVVPADLMFLCGLDPPPGYADLQEARLKKPSKDVAWQSAEWHHFRMHRDGGPPTLVVVLGMRSRISLPQPIARDGDAYIHASGMWAMPPAVTWRVWLYEHCQGRGWVCLDPRDDTHEVVRTLRSRMILEALR